MLETFGFVAALLALRLIAYNLLTVCELPHLANLFGLTREWNIQINRIQIDYKLLCIECIDTELCEKWTL